MSRTSQRSPLSTMSIAPTLPPALPIDEVTSPSVPGWFSSLMRRVRLNEALGVNGIDLTNPPRTDLGNPKSP
jgi:hypothetical protein